MNVSIVVASYNYDRYLREALNSIVAQTHANWEAIIVDDGSTDDSVRVASTYLADPRFRLIEQPHLGQPATKNNGISAARGEFIAFLDADDRWHPTKLQKQLAVMRQPQVGVVYSRRRVIDPDGRVSGGDNRVLHRGHITSPMYRDNFVCFSSAMVRRSVFDSVGTFDERINVAIDYDLWLRASRVCDFDYVDEPLVDYRVGHANLSRRVAERLDTVMGIMERFRHEVDRPAMLDPLVAQLALAETYRHRGIVARNETGAGRAWLRRSLQVRPFDMLTWRALVATFVPSELRRWRRAITGIPNWETALSPQIRKAA